MNRFTLKLPSILLILAVTLVNQSCSLRKKLLDSNVVLTALPSGSADKMKKNQFNLEDLSLRIKASYSDGKVEQGFTLNVKMINDSAVWASVTAFNIEIARALVTADSFKMIDRMNKKYFVGDIAMLERFTGQKFTLSQLQDLFTGNPFYPADDYSQKHDDLRLDHLKYSDSTISNSVRLTEGFRIRHSELITSETSQTADVEYDVFEKIKKSGSLPTKTVLNFNGSGKDLKLTMNYISVSIDEIHHLSFTIPDKYAKGM